MKNKIFTFSLVVMTMLLIFSNGCKRKKKIPESTTTPELTTTSVGNITTTTAISGGAITSDGNASITAYGVCWSTAPNPTISDSKTTDGSGSGSFISTISGLIPGTHYYVRAYASNSAGTGYGNVESFTTITSTDNTPPVITLNGSNMKVTQFTGTYNEPGASATDNIDGTVNVVISGTVNLLAAGDYIITYTATDAASNTASKIRNINVSGSDYLAGFYTAEDFTGTSSNGIYPETITASSIVNNKINFTKFGYYLNGTVFGMVSGTTITIPQQTVNCGMPSADRTFSGSGNYTNNFTSFTVNYTEVTNGVTVNGHDVYVKN